MRSKETIWSEGQNLIIASMDLINQEMKKYPELDHYLRYTSSVDDTDYLDKYRPLYDEITYLMTHEPYMGYGMLFMNNDKIEGFAYCLYGMMSLMGLKYKVDELFVIPFYPNRDNSDLVPRIMNELNLKHYYIHIHCLDINPMTKYFLKYAKEHNDNYNFEIENNQWYISITTDSYREMEEQFKKPSN